MKKNLLFLVALVLTVHSMSAQTFISSEYLGNKTIEELEAFDTPIFNGTNYYRIVYETTDIDGSTTQASGLLCIPDDLTKRYPQAVYQHGTAADDLGVPSFLSFESNIAMVLSGKGYVVCAPDYLGLGVDDGLHPYVHAESEAWVAADMLRAIQSYLVDNNVEVNDQMFVTGYSQGGHAAMALHRMMELELSNEFTVTAAAPMSGPYSIGDVMRGLTFSEEPYSNPGYLVYTLVSYQEVYGNLYTSIEDAVKEPYQQLVMDFAADQVSLADMNAELIDLLNQNEGATIAGKTFKDEFVQEVLDDPMHPVNIALAENDVYDWAPVAPTRMYYCEADEQVPFENSLVAEAAMQDNGAADAEAVLSSDSPIYTHAFCAFLAPTQAAEFFAEYQVIEDLNPSSILEKAATPLEISPNPASDMISIRNFPAEGIARIYDMGGKVQFEQNIKLGNNRLNIGSLGSGVYVIKVVSEKHFWTEKIMVH